MYIFVSDFFLEDLIGGAELTSEAIIDACNLDVQKIHSAHITLDFIKSNKDKYWIFGNFSQLPGKYMYFISQNIKYSVIEYDYKFCKYRTLEGHVFYENKKCDCHLEYGKVVTVFYAKAASLWFMSLKQKHIFEDKLPLLKKQNSHVLSSVFDKASLKKLKNLKMERNNKWIILNSNSWIKGTQDAISYAKKNNLEYQLIDNLLYDDMLNVLASSKGLIFLPRGGDTCPRIVIEAKLLGCKLILNKNVQHAEEDWFLNKEKIFGYLSYRAVYFWNQLQGDSL